MERLQRWLSRPLRIFWVILMSSLALPADALYFYLNSTTPKCFYKELPRDTLVVGRFPQEHTLPDTSIFKETVVYSNWD